MQNRINRRGFFEVSAQKIVSMVEGGWGIETAAAADLPSGDDLVVTIFLRGACDALSFISPLSGKDRDAYESGRPTIRIEKEGVAASLKLDDRFGLHPSAKELYALYQKQKLAVVCAAGLTADTRSHFDAQAFMEFGTPGKKNSYTGWLTRYLEAQSRAPRSSAPLSPLTTGRIVIPAVSVGTLMPTSLLSFGNAVVINSLSGFNLARYKNFQDDQLAALGALYSGQGWIDPYAHQTLSAIRTFSNFKEDEEVLAQRATYPKSDLAGKLKTLAELLRMELGIRVANVDMGGWDTHKQQGAGTEGTFHNQVQQLSQAIDAFYTDLEKNSPSLLGRFTLVVMTEFGRRLKENANRGTDHGHGAFMLVLGEKIKGGQVFGEWPGLETAKLYERADLAVVTDYRSVLSEVLLGSLSAVKARGVFPDFKPGAKLGLLKPRVVSSS